jgi:hypothetical protein
VLVVESEPTRVAVLCQEVRVRLIICDRDSFNGIFNPGVTHRQIRTTAQDRGVLNLYSVTLECTNHCVVHQCCRCVKSMSAHFNEDARWRSWLRHSATSGKVACSIPDEVFEVSH